MNLSKRDREQLRMMFGGRCAYCGCELPAKGWHADHIEPLLRQPPRSQWGLVDGKVVRTQIPRGPMRPKNDHAGNLVPSCRACNIDKGGQSAEEWREWLNSRIVDGLRRNSATFRHAERFGRVTINPGPLTFWFERYTAEQPAQPSAEKAGE